MMMLVALPATVWGQVTNPARQQQLDDWHSATQKTALATLGITTSLGFSLFANKESLFTDGLCKAGDPMMGDFGCNGGLAIVHFVFAGATLAFFIASEIIATQMNPSPYETGDARRDGASSTIRWVNVGLFSLQPLLGLIAAHPGLIGIPSEHRATVSRWLRTAHFGVGLGIMSTYSVQAGMQW